MRKNLNVIAAYSIMMGLIILVGIFQSWNIALSIFNLCLISAVMTMGANIQWGYAGLINFGIMGYTALGGLAAVLISVNPKPTIDAGNDQDICFGDSTSLNASGSSISYIWSNGLPDGTQFEITTTLNYTVTGTDINSCSNSDTVAINVLDLPLIDAGQDETICLGDSVQLFATGGISYQWSPNTNINNNFSYWFHDN